MLKRIFTVSVVVMTIVWAVGLAAFVPVAQAAVVSGDLIKASGAAVYYMGADGKRYVFPNEKTYMTWYPNFSGVKTITDAELAAIQIGGNVTMRPGVKMGKITTDPKVYAIGSNGTLRWVTTAAIAECLYGANWGTMIDDISDAFFVNYTIGAPINACADFSPAAVTAAATSINVDKGLVAGGPIVGTAFTASLAADTPASQTLALGATGVPVLKFNLTGTGTLNEVVLKRTGLGKVSDYAAVYLYNGATRLTSGRTISSDTNTVTFGNINLAISGSAALTVKVEVATTATPADQNAISLQSVNGNVVAGITGNLMTIGSVAVSTVTVSAVTASWDVTLGSANVELARFKIDGTAAINDTALYAITLRQGGSLSNTNLANLTLKSGSYELATIASLTGDKAIFVLAAPFTIPKGQMKTFSVYGDVTGGRTGDEVKFYVDFSTDVDVMDMQYGVGAAVTATAFALNSQIVNIKGGQITLGNAGPASTSYATSTTGNALVNVNMSAERNVTVRKTYLLIKSSITVAGDLALIKNIKVVDLDTGSTLVGPITDLNNFLGQATDIACTTADLIGTGCYVVSNDSFDLNVGQTRHTAVKFDLGTSATLAGNTVSATLDLAPTITAVVQSNYVYDNDSSEYVLNSNIVPTSVSGVNQTITASQLTVSVAGIPTNAAYVRGTASGDALGINFNAGISDSLKLNRLTALVYADSTGGAGTWPTAAGDSAANLTVDTASLYDGTTLIKGPVNLSLVDNVGSNGIWDAGDWYKADFTNIAYSIPAGSQKKLVVRLSYRNTSPAVETAVGLDLPAAVEVENSLGNLINPLGTDINTGVAKSPYQNILLSGTVAVAVDGNTTAADIALGGSINVNTVKYKISATDEAFTVTGAQIRLSTTAVGGDVINVKVTYANASGTTVTKTGQLAGNLLTFSDGQLDMYVPVNSSAIMTIAADLNTTGAGATSGSVVKLCLDNASATCAGGAANLTNQFVVLGVASNTKLFGTLDTITVDNTNVKGQTLRKTKITAVNTLAGGPSSVGTQTIIGKFKLNSTSEAGSNQNSVLGSVTVAISGGFLGGPANASVSVYRTNLDAANIMMAAPIAVVCVANSCTPTALTLTQNNDFSGEVEILVVANTTVAPFLNTAADDALSTALNTWTWNDGTAGGAASTPVAGFPVVPPNALTF